MLVPVDTLSVRDLALQLASGPFPEWCTYQGKAVIDLPVDYLIMTDPDFYDFWTCRLVEEATALDCILTDGDFLDLPVARFFASPGCNEATLRQLLPKAGETVREWALRRRRRVAESLAYHKRCLS